MPLSDALLGTEADGAPSPHYCKYCYQNGAFTCAMTMEEMMAVREVVTKALEEARYAPTASNCEEVAWLLVEGRDRLHDLASRVADWMSTLTGKYSHVASAFRAGQDPILRGAPSLILAHGDANMPWNALDCAAAVSYLELALHSYGIGTCWSGFVIAAASNGVDLGIPLPEGRKICGGLMIGYPAVQYARVPPRKPVRLTVIE